MSDPYDQDPRDQDTHEQELRDLDGSREQAEPAEGAAEASPALRALGVAETEALASQLVWRVGRLSDDDPVTVRVGFATSARLFADLPKLKNASDHEVETAIKEGEIRVEWVGQPPA